MDDDFSLDFGDSDFDASDFELPSIDDILSGIEQPDLADILSYDSSDILADDYRGLEDTVSDSDTATDDFDLADLADEALSFADEIRDESDSLSEIADLVSQALEDNLHPSELENNIDGMANDDVINQIIEDYTDALEDKLGLDSEGHHDDENFTSRGQFETYEDVIAYLDSFHGGFPADDIFDIELTDEGYELYVAEDTP